MKKHIVLISAAVLFSGTLLAQGEIDALRFSGNDLTGSARGAAMAGAFGALGGDITGIASNPAGIAVYRSSEVLTTLNFENVASKTDITKNKFKFNFDNVAYVGYFPTGGDNVKSFHFGFSYNRLKNFERKYNTIGMKLTGGSLTDYMAYRANVDNRGGAVVEGDIGIDKSDPYWPFNDGQSWLPVLGYNGYLINPPSGTASNYGSVLKLGETFNNDLMVTEKGSIASYDFNFGMNVADVLLLGATLSATDIRYRMESSHMEFFEKGGEFELNNWVETDGTGFGLKLGAIVRPIEALRIGVAYHSPIWYDMSDTYSASLYHNVYDKDFPAPSSGANEANKVYRSDKYPGSDRVGSGEHYFDYRFQSPQKWIFSLAGVVQDWAVLNLDYEMKDYTGMDYSSADGMNVDYSLDNKTIDAHYRVASTVKFGAEFRLTPQFSVRGGFAWMQSPLEKVFKEQKGISTGSDVLVAGSVANYVLDDDAYHYTFGFGYRFTPNFYIDIASVVKTQDSNLYAFPVIEGDVVSQAVPFTTKTFKGLITLGYKF